MVVSTNEYVGLLQISFRRFSRTSTENSPVKFKMQLQNFLFSLLENLQNSPKHNRQIINP